MAEEDDQTTRKLELSPVQVAASALAAVSAAFFASWAGTAGTLIGAALGSVIATVGAATYSYSLKRTSEIARRTALQVREGALLPPGLPRTRRGPEGEPLDETSVLPAADGEVSGAGSEHATPDDEAGSAPWWRRLDPRGADLPWGKVALAAAAVMLVTMAVLTSFEGLTGRSVSDTVTGNDTGRTTVGNVFGGGSDEQREQPSDEPSQQPTEDPTAPGTTTPSPTAEPTEEPTEDPSGTPTPSPSTTITQSPSPTTTTDGSGGDGAESQPQPEPSEAPEATPSS